MLLGMEDTEYERAKTLLRSIVRNRKELVHNDVKLIQEIKVRISYDMLILPQYDQLNMLDFLQDLKQMTYVDGHCVKYTIEGLRVVFQHANNQKMKANSDGIFAALEQFKQQVLQKTKVRVFKANEPSGAADAEEPGMSVVVESDALVLYEPSGAADAEEPVMSVVVQSDALVMYEPFKPHPDAEDQELELLQVALVNTYLTPEVQQAMDKLCLEWEADDAALEEEAAAVKKAPYGVVYAVRCQLFGHLIKPGYTMRSPQVRAKELSSTGVPVPYDVVAALYCFNPSQVEKRVHQHFAASRTYGKKKEFFGLTIMQVDRYFTVLAHELIGSDPNLYEPRAKINKRKAEEQDTALKAVRAELAAQSALLKQVLERLPAGSK